MQLRMALQIMQAPEPCLAGRALVWLLLAVCEKMTFQIVMAGEICGAVRALVSLGGW